MMWNSAPPDPIKRSSNSVWVVPQQIWPEKTANGHKLSPLWLKIILITYGHIASWIFWFLGPLVNAIETTLSRIWDTEAPKWGTRSPHLRFLGLTFEALEVQIMYLRHLRHSSEALEALTAYSRHSFGILEAHFWATWGINHELEALEALDVLIWLWASLNFGVKIKKCKNEKVKYCNRFITLSHAQTE